jgi:hypothetical protein
LLSIDRLGAIILTDFLPFYRYWKPSDRAPSKELLQLNWEAHTIWDAGMVVELALDEYEVTVSG